MGGIVSLAHDHESPSLRASRDEQPTDDELRGYDAIVQEAIRRAASRGRILVRYRVLFAVVTLIAFVGLGVGLVSLFVSDKPDLFTSLAGVAAGLGSGAAGILIGSRLEYQRRSQRAELLRRLLDMDSETRTSAASGDGDAGS